MRFHEFLSELKIMNLPKNEFAIFGSGPLAIRKIRDTNDLDIIVKPQLWEELSSKYAEENAEIIRIGNIEMFRDWKPWFDNADELIESADMIDAFPFVKLEYVLKWKSIMNREKDQKDIKMIEEFLMK